MDIQYIHEKSMVLNRYITCYVTKKEKSMIDTVWEDCNNKKTLQGALKSFALKSFQNREIGAYEVADRILGHHLYGKSDFVKYLGNCHHNFYKKV